MREKKPSATKIKFTKKYIKRYKIILPSLFIGLLVVGMVISMIIPLRPKFSEFEKRNLAEFPKFSFSSLFDSSFFRGIDKWFSDTFPFREKLIAGNAKLEEMRGFGDKIYGLNNDVAVEIPDSNNVTEDPEITEHEPTVPDQIGEVTQKLSNIVVIGNSGYEYCSFNQSVADKYVSVLNRTAKQLDGISTVYTMPVPTSIDITMSDNVRKNINTCDQSKVIDYVLGSVSENVKGVNIYKTMRMNRDKYIYYRTDHHWTALGAYYAYSDLITAMGEQPNYINRYKKTSYGEFLGSFYSDTNSSAMRNNPDDLIAYVPPYRTELKYTESSGRVIDWKLINDVSDYPTAQKYSAFTAGDNPYTIIKNEDVLNEKTCLIIKESFGNAVIPYIVGHYKTVHVIDYRYYKSGFISFAKENNVDDVIFINNVSALRAANLIDRMNSIAV